MIDLAGATGVAAYGAVFLAAILEGEVLFVTASALVSQGKLHALPVVIAGALGATLGDQFYFYALRGRLRRWVDRSPSVARRGARLVARVKRNEWLTVLTIRFSPGLRIALAAACAYAGVAPAMFSALSIVSSFAWAAGLLTLVAYAGPKWLPGLGISGWWTAIIPAILLVVLFRTLAKVEEEEISR
jgi:membrane protein DedA with SNARE-associated domain